jgi:hypothetical protein
MSKGTGKFGWCLTGHHDQCRIILTVVEKKCACECHAASQNNDNNV